MHEKHFVVLKFWIAVFSSQENEDHTLFSRSGLGNSTCFEDIHHQMIIFKVTRRLLCFICNLFHIK